MKFINNRITDFLVRTLGIQSAGQAVTDFKPDIQPTLDTFPPCNIVVNQNKTSTGTATLYTTPTKGDFYLRWIYMGVTKDAACDGTTASVSVFINGLNFNIFRLYMQTLTAGNEHEYLLFPGQGILLDKNTAIASGMTFGAGTSTVTTTIGGTLIESI